MTHKNQQTIAALTKVTKIMIELWYADTSDLSVGNITRAVDKCSEIFQFIESDETVEAKLIAVLELCEEYEIYFREPKR